jgi:hypothetical protein
MPPRAAETAASKLSEGAPLNPSRSKGSAIAYGSANGNDGAANEASRRDILLRAPSGIRASMQSMKSFIDEHTGESLAILVLPHRPASSTPEFLKYCNCSDSVIIKAKLGTWGLLPLPATHSRGLPCCISQPPFIGLG